MPTRIKAWGMHYPVIPVLRAVWKIVLFITIITQLPLHRWHQRDEAVNMTRSPLTSVCTGDDDLA